MKNLIVKTVAEESQTVAGEEANVAECQVWRKKAMNSLR